MNQWPKIFGRYKQASKAYYALSLQTSDRFYVEREGELWVLKLSQW